MTLADDAVSRRSRFGEAWDRVFDPLLRFGFFHGSLGFGGAFRAGFATFLALFVEDLFAAQ